MTGLPFVTVNGRSALRLDLADLKFYVFGSVIWLKEFYLLLFAVLFFLLLITAVTTVFGRVWCGWLCPQTVLLDLSESIARRLSLIGKEGARHLVLLLFSSLVSITLLWYFVPPFETLGALFRAPVITSFFLVQWAIVYAELAFLGRRFCTTVCPYAMMQNALFDKDTLVIEYDKSRENECMHCDDCVSACPVGIDIKEGLSSSCIACAECIDACAAVTAKRSMRPFPGYRGRLARPRTFWLGGITLVAGAVLFLMVFARPEVTFLISRDSDRMPEGINRYSWSLYNNGGERQVLELTVRDGFEAIGETSLVLEPYSFRKGRVLVRSTGGKGEVVFRIEGDRVHVEKKRDFFRNVALFMC
ncbi:4Fe-4S dicluster domain-containing protein [Prosthecochloris sp. GSB1]|uniref:4Fe-4S dicluster domain-containing protein n=1 Tax=Prosthecochloris sp. GSB1 TaxID=281093 RepID=UPI001F2EF51F|nr:4Fe-4S dicluster domain-containing protein [Prosthecochloris sp. GSB1]